MGSSEIWDLKYRHGFSFIGISGAEQVVESASDDVFGYAEVSASFEITGIGEEFTG